MDSVSSPPSFCGWAGTGFKTGTTFVLDVSAMPNIAINTDHALVKTTLRINLRGNMKDKEESVARYRKPTEEE